VEAQRVDSLAVKLASDEVVDLPDIVAGLEDGAGLLVGLKRRRGGEASRGEKGGGEELELHIDGCVLESYLYNKETVEIMSR